MGRVDGVPRAHSMSRRLSVIACRSGTWITQGRCRSGSTSQFGGNFALKRAVSGTTTSTGVQRTAGTTRIPIRTQVVTNLV